MSDMQLRLDIFKLRFLVFFGKMRMLKLRFLVYAIAILVAASNKLNDSGDRLVSVGDRLILGKEVHPPEGGDDAHP